MLNKIFKEAIVIITLLKSEYRETCKLQINSSNKLRGKVND